MATYIVNGGVLEFVLLLVVEDEAVLLDETHDWRLPSWALQEGYQAVELKVFADNATMLRLVLSLGFIPVDIDHRRRMDGADMVYLKKYL